MRNDNTNIEALCESARNSIEAINEKSADERSGVYVNMQDIFQIRRDKPWKTNRRSATR